MTSAEVKMFQVDELYVREFTLMFLVVNVVEYRQSNLSLPEIFLPYKLIH